MDTSKINEIAQSIVDSVMDGKNYAPLPADVQAASLAQTYAIQAQVYERLGRQANLGELAGHKIALTSKAVQELCGVSQPLYGAFFASQIYPTPAQVKLADFGRLGLEFEVAVQIGSTVPVLEKDDAPYSARTIKQYVAACMPAFELIDDRNADYSQLDAVSLATDRCWCAGAVLGQPQTDWQDVNLSDAPVELLVNGESKAKAVTGDSMGHPFNGLAWVANHVTQEGRQLQAGDVVITGSALKTLFPKSGESYVYRIDGLGEVALNIA